MKKLFPVFAILALFLVGCSTESTIAPLPGDVTDGIGWFIALVVSWVFVRLIALLPFLQFLDQFRTPLTLALTSQVIVWLEAVIPTGYDDVAVSGFRFLLAVVAVVFGVLKVLQVKKVNGFQ